MIDLKKIIKRYKRVGYNMDTMRQSACLVVNPIMVGSYILIFNCTTVGQTSDLMMVFNLLVDACCLSLAGPTLAQLVVLFSSDYL